MPKVTLIEKFKVLRPCKEGAGEGASGAGTGRDWGRERCREDSRLLLSGRDVPGSPLATAVGVCCGLGLGGWIVEVAGVGCRPEEMGSGPNWRPWIQRVVVRDGPMLLNGAGGLGAKPESGGWG